MPSRRRLLSVTIPLTASLGGCINQITESQTETTRTTLADPDYDGVPSPEDDYPNNHVAAEQIIDISESVTIPPTEIEAYSINAETDGFIKYEFLSEGGPIDVFFMDSEDYTKWQQHDADAEYRVVLSFLNSANDSTEQLLPKGEWVLALDHTSSRTLPNESPVEVDFELEVGVESDTSN